MGARRGLIVLDTHTLFWWVAAPQRLSRRAARLIVRSDQIGIPVVSIFELTDLATRGRVELGTPVRGWVDRALSREGATALPLTAEIAMDAGQLRFVADPTDRLIYATARAAGAYLITRDEKIRRFDPALTVW